MELRVISCRDPLEGLSRGVLLFSKKLRSRADSFLGLLSLRTRPKAFSFMFARGPREGDNFLVTWTTESLRLRHFSLKNWVCALLLSYSHSEDRRR